MILSVLPKDNYWSEPDTDHAAEMMNFVFNNQEYAKKIGEQAKLDINKQLSLHTIGMKMKTRLNVIENFILPERDETHVKRQSCKKLMSENKILEKGLFIWKKGLYNKARKKVNEF